jgi:hypothetical protein
MKKYCLLLAGVTMSLATLAQSPVPDPDTLRTPTKQGDPAPDTPPPTNYRADQQRVMAQDIPAPLRQTLEADPRYQGWQKATIYKNRSGSIYTIEFKEADKSRFYRFDKTGKSIAE